MQEGGIAEDSARGAVDRLAKLGVPELVSAETVPDAWGTSLRVTDAGGQVYYLGFGGFGYLEIIRKDSIDGEVVFAYIE